VSPARVAAVFRRDVTMSPRSAVLFLAIATPVVITVLFQLVFGSLFEPKPRLGIVDLGESSITTAVQQMDGIETSIVRNERALRARVARHDLDAGLVLPAGFDRAVRDGERPELRMYASGESLASDRIILLVTTVDQIRRVEGNPSPVDVQVTTVGDTDALPLIDRLLPMVVLYALIVAGVFLTAFNLVDEREKRTLEAVLVTPVQLTEVLVAKALFGFLLAVVISFATLALNGLLGTSAGPLLVALLVAALMSAEFGLLFGTAARDVKTLYTLIKTINIILFAPVFFYLFPEWPRWIAMLFPTYWFFDPIFTIALEGATLGDVWRNLLVALAFCALLVPAIGAMARRMERTVALG